jgi:3-hydroxymyristoyl/3-hydroxydecanoyl-(acyl carrier protein) dehydratase
MIESEMCIPEWSALFEGHFEGQPVLSGVSQLFLLQHLLERQLPGVVPREIGRLRFRATVGPREALCFQISEVDEEGLVRVSVQRQGQPVLQGVIRVG